MGEDVNGHPIRLHAAQFTLADRSPRNDSTQPVRLGWTKKARVDSQGALLASLAWWDRGLQGEPHQKGIALPGPAAAKDGTDGSMVERAGEHLTFSTPYEGSRDIYTISTRMTTARDDDSIMKPGSFLYLSWRMSWHCIVDEAQPGTRRSSILNEFHTQHLTRVRILWVTIRNLLLGWCLLPSSKSPGLARSQAAIIGQRAKPS